MFYNWNILIINNEEVLYLFVQNNYEFLSNLYAKDDNKLIAIIKNYLKENKISFNGKKIYIVFNNLVIGIINNLKFKKYIDFENYLSMNNNARISSENKNSTAKYINYIKNYISYKTPKEFEKEAMKVLIIILKANCISEIEKYGQIVNEKDMIDIINDTYVERKINQALEETKNDYLITNNHLPFLEDISDKLKLQKINTMAKVGYSFKQILNHLYPNSKFKSL